MPTAAAPSPQLDLFLRDTLAYQKALARYETLRPILQGRSSPQCAVKSLSGHPACFLARFRELLLHLLSMRPLPLIVLRHIEVTFACTPDLVLLGQ